MMRASLAEAPRVPCVNAGALPRSSSTAASKRAVAVMRCGLDQRAPHEVATLQFAARRVGRLLGLPCQDDPVDPGEAVGCYCVPITTLSRVEAIMHGIVGESDLWGGVVGEAFMATKLVSHPLWPGATHAPLGWQALSGIEACTLPGFAVFTRRDLIDAVSELLHGGVVRLKSPFERGGHGQSVVSSSGQLRRWLAGTPNNALRCGVVVERHLEPCVTYSVGGSYLPGHVISYHGRQGATLDRLGREVYAGSVLTVYNGPIEAMRNALPDGDLIAVVDAAMGYDRAMRESYGVDASRWNYDVIVGTDSEGQRHLGVLEQSWRFGGASMAELLAMEWFAQHPSEEWVVAETVERYADAALPAHAVCHWKGGEDFQSPTKYARIVGHGYRA